MSGVQIWQIPPPRCRSCAARVTWGDDAWVHGDGSGEVVEMDHAAIPTFKMVGNNADVWPLHEGVHHADMLCRFAGCRPEGWAS